MFATVALLRALQARTDHFPASVMQVQQWHLDQLRDRVERNRCDSTDALPHLRTLRAMGDDIDAAFSSLAANRRFVQHAAQQRGALDQALRAPPSTCDALSTTVRLIEATCRDCHQDFR